MMKNNDYQLGLVSVSFRKYTVKEILDEMKATGLSCVEWGSDVHAPCNDVERLCEIAAMQKEYGIECVSYGTYFRFGETPMEELESYIKAAKILNTNVLRLWCGRKSGADMTAEEKNEMLSMCRQAAAIAEKHEVTLCLESHQLTLTENPDDAVWLMQEVNSPNFRMYWQPFQWQTTEENCVNAAKIAPYAEHIHVFYRRDGQKVSLHEAIGEWQAYLQKFSTPRALLLEFMPKGSIEELAAEAAALRMIAGETV